MGTTREGHKPKLGAMMSGAFLLALAVGGVLALLYFWNQLLKPDELGTLSLPLVALIGGLAATFNPCGLPVLPGFLTFMGASGEDTGVRRRAELSVSAALGAMTLVILVGIIVGFVGAGTKGLIGPQQRWIQLAVGIFLVALASLHLMNRTSHLPFVGPIMGLGSRAWNQATGKPTVRGSYLFGSGFVLVGVG